MTLYRAFAQLLYGGVLTGAVVLAGVVVRHEHRRGMARLRAGR